MENLNEIWEVKNASQYKQVDDSSEVDGQNILAKVSGPAFFPDTTSRNNNHYSLAVWESALGKKEFNTKLERKLVLGTIGHNLDLSDDDVREGRFSHIVSKVWIDENNVGQAEYLILNTPPGRVLNTLIRSGSRMYVSTKATGSYKKSENKQNVIDAKDFVLNRIDFVLDPGYLDANPELVESLGLKYNNKKDENNMSEKIESAAVVAVNESSKEFLSFLKDQNKSNEDKLEESTTKMGGLFADNGKLKTENATLVAENLDLTNQVTDNINDNQNLTEQNESYKELGTVEEIDTALDKSKEMIESYKELGTIDDIDTALSESINVIESYKRDTKLLEEYRELGSPKDIGSALDKLESIINQKIESGLSGIAEEFKIELSIVEDLHSKGMNMEQVRTTIEGIKASTVTENLNKGLDTNTFKKKDLDESMKEIIPTRVATVTRMEKYL